MRVKPSSPIESRPGLLSSNPFAILGVTPLDERTTIIEHAEERGLHGDQAACQRARSDLTNPRTRVQAELAWFPGVEPALVASLRAALAADPVSAMTSPPGLAPLPRANLMCAGFEQIKPRVGSAAKLAEWMREFGDVVDRLELAAIVSSLNADRKVSNFPSVQDMGVVDEALTAMRKQYKDVLMDLLDRMPSAMLVETMIALVSRATVNGTVTASALVDDLVDAYALETQVVLEAERENMTKMAERILAQGAEGEAQVASGMERVLLVARHWCQIAKPTQLSMKARGMANVQSEQLASELRELGVGLFNQHGMWSMANRMTSALLEIFSSVPRVCEQLEADALRLKEIEDERLQIERWDMEWRRAISFEARAGLFSKHPLRIGPDGVTWQGQHLRLDEISQVRWGRYRQLLNGFPVGTYHSVDVSNGRIHLQIRMRNEAMYTAFTHSLWRAVCVRLMYEMANHLKTGATLSFGAVQVRDDGLSLGPRRLGWNDVKLTSSNGYLVIHAKSGVGKGELSYAKAWNVHMLEQLIRTALERGSVALSDYLSDPSAA